MTKQKDKLLNTEKTVFESFEDLIDLKDNPQLKTVPIEVMLNYVDSIINAKMSQIEKLFIEKDVFKNEYQEEYAKKLLENARHYWVTVFEKHTLYLVSRGIFSIISHNLVEKFNLLGIKPVQDKKNPEGLRMKGTEYLPQYLRDMITEHVEENKKLFDAAITVKAACNDLPLRVECLTQIHGRYSVAKQTSISLSTLARMAQARKFRMPSLKSIDKLAALLKDDPRDLLFRIMQLKDGSKKGVIRAKKPRKK